MSSEDEYGLNDDTTWQGLLDSGGFWNLEDAFRAQPSTNTYCPHPPTNQGQASSSSSSSFTPTRQQHTNSHPEQNPASTSTTSTFNSASSASTATSYGGSQQPHLPQHRRTVQPVISTRGLAPVSDHTEDWLDLSETAREFDPEPFIDYTREGLFDSDSEIHHDAFQPTPPESQMPSTTRARHRQSIVDLTDGLSSPVDHNRPAAATRKRSVVPSSSSSTSAAKKAKNHNTVVDIEELDLTNEAPTIEEELLQNQQQEAINAQRDGDQAGPQKVGKLICNICLENFTNATVTACGHIFCHECITQALIASEKSTESANGKCPLCRKVLSRKKANNMIPVQFMKRSAFKGRHGIPG